MIGWCLKPYRHYVNHLTTVKQPLTQYFFKIQFMLITIVYVIISNTFDQAKHCNQSCMKQINVDIQYLFVGLLDYCS